VRSISQRAENDALLAPKHIHLTFVDTPVEQAVADFAKQTGYTIRLVGDTKKLARRKVTLETGETIFWKAFDQFCEKADLVEASPTAVYPRVPQHLPMQPAPPLRRGAAIKVKGALQVAAVNVQLVAPPAAAPVPAMPLLPATSMIMRPAFGFGNLQLLVEDGKPDKVPTSYFRAVRVRLAPPRLLGNQQPAAEGEVVVTLEVTPEPRIQWRNVINVRLDTAVDEKGQTLALVSDQPGMLNGGGIMVAPGIVRPHIRRPNWVMMNGRLLPLRLKAGDKSSKTLKQLKGTINANVQTEVKTLMTVDDLLNATNKIVKNDAGTLRVVEIKDNKDGAYVLRVEMTRSNEVIAGVPASATGLPGAIRPRPVGQPVAPVPPPRLGGVKGGPMIPARAEMRNYIGLTVLDAKGHALPLSPTSINTMVAASGQWTQQLTMTLKPGDGDGKPAKLTFSGSRIVAVAVPFDLTNVRLPGSGQELTSTEAAHGGK